jgi:adenylate kinase family enzyme
MARLILIDGLPGTGKTTLAQDLSRELSLIGLECHVPYETDRPHPLHPIQTDAMGAAWANIRTLLTPQEFTKLV